MNEPPTIPRVLLTAFDTYRDGAHVYYENASRLALQQLHLRPPSGVKLETRIYSVEFATIRRRIEEDIARGFDLVILTGQAPSAGNLRLETRAKNLGVDPNGTSEAFPLALDGPAILESTIDWRLVVGALANSGEQTGLSNDAGSYLCNAALYFAILAAIRRWRYGASELQTRVGFVHVPLAPQQVGESKPCMPTEKTAMHLRELIAAAIETT